MKRYLSLDILRGLTIFGMVFSAIIPYGVLPAWMYHIQTPPPNHAFDPTLSGVSWVDLVFPIFIFCMGMAIPFAGRARIEAAKGANVTKAYLGSTLVRFLMLWLFSYLYVLLNFSTAGGWIAQLATVAGFAALFLVYYVFPKNPQGRFQIWANTNKRIIRIAGVISVALLIAAGNLFLGEEVSIYRSGIIIFLLAFLYLFGSLIWYFTRDNLRARIVIFFLIVLFAAVTMSYDLQPKMYAIKEIRWFFNMEYIYFLLILLPATWVGDLVRARVFSAEGYSPVKDAPVSKAVKVFVLIYIFAILLWLMFALYGKWTLYTFLFSSGSFALLWFVMRNLMPVYKKETLLALVLMILGGATIFAEGSISKSPFTISYSFITAAISIYLLIITDFISAFNPRSMFVRIFAGAGSNPLMSYIAFGSLVMPLFKLTGLILVYQAAYPAGWPWIGVARAAVAVLLTMSIVAYLSERKIFWRA